MTPIVHADIPRKEILPQKGFVLVYLFATSFNWPHQEANICGKKIFFSSIHFLERFFF